MPGDSVFVNIGASNHSTRDRVEDDYYATEPKAVELLLKHETFSNLIWEPAVGGGHIANVLCDNGYYVMASDILDRGYPGTVVVDFLHPRIDTDMSDYMKMFKLAKDNHVDIITNPPYSLLDEFIKKGMEILEPGHKMAIFVRLQAIEGQARRKIYEKYPIKTIYVPSARLKCLMNGEEVGKGSAVCYSWFVWTKGYEGDTTIKWLD